MILTYVNFQIKYRIKSFWDAVVVVVVVVVIVGRDN